MFCTATAAASPYDVGWGSLGIGLGPHPLIGGELAQRAHTEGCANGECKLGSRFAFAGGYGHWAVELQVNITQLVDTWSKDGSRRTAFLWGPHLRYTLFRRHGLDLSVRTGLEHGSIDGEDTSSGCSVEQPQCSSMTYHPPAYSTWALSGGVTAVWRLRMDDGFYGIQVDFDATILRAAYPDRSVDGTIRGTTIGL